MTSRSSDPREAAAGEVLAAADTADAIPQAAARRLLLTAIRGHAPASNLLELRWRAPGESMHQSFHDCKDISAVSARAAVLGVENDVYIACAPRTRRFGGVDAIERVWCLWSDLDTADAVEQLASFEPQPSIVIASGSPGATHCWWALNAPLSPAHARAALRRLAHRLGGDMAAAEAARILRLPGTSNHKTDPPAAVTCTRLELDSFHAREIVGGLPDLPERRAQPAPAATPRRATDHDELLTIPASEYVPLLTGHQVGRDGKAICPLHDERTPSLHAYPDDQGWWCFGCQRGGTIIDLGAAIYGINPRGRGFHDIRRRLASDLLSAVAA